MAMQLAGNLRRGIVAERRERVLFGNLVAFEGCQGARKARSRRLPMIRKPFGLRIVHPESFFCHIFEEPEGEDRQSDVDGLSCETL